MRTDWIVAAGMAAIAVAPAIAQDADPVKAGVDAWSRGDYWAAVEQWRAPATSGNPDAQFNMGQAYKLGRGVAADPVQAQEWYRRAALQGHPQAEDNYGLALFQNGHREEAVPWLERSARRGEPRAQFILGTMYFNGDAVERDWVKAYALMVRSSQSGLPQANDSLAKMDEHIAMPQRQQGLVLARQLEEEANRPQLPLEFAEAGSEPAANEPAPPQGRVREVPVPPSAPATPPEPVTVTAAAPARAAAAAPAPAAAARDGGWRVQLGAFREPGNARTMWGNVSHLAALDGRQPYYVRAGALTKLLVGPYASRGDATRGCTAIKAAGRDCLVVAP